MAKFNLKKLIKKTFSMYDAPLINQKTPRKAIIRNFGGRKKCSFIRV